MCVPLYRCKEINGDYTDIVRLCRQIMNKCNAKRLISKQEASLLLADMKLTHCSEKVEDVSIAQSKQLRTTGPDKKRQTILDQYSDRSLLYANESLYEFFHRLKNKGDKKSIGAIIPHFIGVSGSPKYPVTADYAKHCLIVHRPWSDYPCSEDWIRDFYAFITHPSCPVEAKLTFERVRARHLTKTTGYEPVASEFDNSKNPIDCSDQEILELTGMKFKDQDPDTLKGLHRGENYNWNKRPKVSDALHMSRIINDYFRLNHWFV